MSTAIETVEKTDIQINEAAKVVVFNDDVNSFDWVILMLTRYCEKSLKEAADLANEIHNSGKAVVKDGEYLDMIPICSALLDNGLSAEIVT